MCPKAFLRECAVYGGIKQLDGISRTRRGSAIHRELQEDFIKSDKLCPIPLVGDQRMAAKLIKNWPEVPFHDMSTGFSGSADCVMQWRGELLPVEIKTTNFENQEKWHEAIKGKFPGKYTPWIMQLCTYIYHFNQSGYWPGKNMSQGVLVVINSCMDPANPASEFEEVIDYSLYKDKISLLLEHCALQRQAVIDNMDLPCSYEFCKEHKPRSRFEP
jgi:hypothetical protein